MVKHPQLARIGVIVALLVIAFLSVACSSGDDASSPGDGDGSPLGFTDLSEDTTLGSLSDDAGAGQAESGSQFQGLLNRKIIQSTSLDVRVEEVGRAFQDIISLAATYGGFVASSSFSDVDDDQQADLTIRVPSNRYQEVLLQFRNMGKLEQQSSDANDVTEEFTDLEARLRTLEATEGRYLELLAEANGINEILLVQDRLDSVRGQIEQVQGRINLLDSLTELATITVHLRTAVPEAEDLEDDGGLDPFDAASKAWESSLITLLALATIAFAVVAYSWWLVPPAVIATLVWRWWTNRRSPPSSRPPASM